MRLYCQNRQANRRLENLTANNMGRHTGSVSCPNCSTPMQEIRRYDADIDYCPSCKGVWLDRGEIDKIAMAQNRIDEEHYSRYHRDRDYDDYDDDYYRYGGHRRRRGFLGDLFDFD
jgi:Zn-finger nucleic acid-binding protein